MVLSFGSVLKTIFGRMGNPCNGETTYQVAVLGALKESHSS